MRVAAAGLVVFFCAGSSPAMSEDAPALQPYQMVRSLQLLQDRIASGDHAALPMQNKILEMIDARLRQADKEDFADKRNFRAMLIYAMSGGNPSTVEAVLLRLKAEPPEMKVAEGVLDYLRGRPGPARAALEAVDPLTEVPELGAFLALVKASVVSNADARVASRLFDEARLLGPGTLIEEAALRRSLSLAVSLADADRFLSLSSQYVRRFLNSPYASQFADSFVDGVVALHRSLNLQVVREIISGMEPDKQKFIYLRIARRGAIDGFSELSAFAAERVEVAAEKTGTDIDPRAELYSILATMTEATSNDVLGRMRRIDRTRLSENDRKLLDAATAVASEIVARPVASAGGEASSVEQEPVRPPTELAAIKVAKSKSPSSNPADASAEAATTTAKAAREKIEAIDKLLGETTE